MPPGNATRITAGNCGFGGLLFISPVQNVRSWWIPYRRHVHVVVASVYCINTPVVYMNERMIVVGACWGVGCGLCIAVQYLCTQASRIPVGGATDHAFWAAGSSICVEYCSGTLQDS